MIYVELGFGRERRDGNNGALSRTCFLETNRSGIWLDRYRAYGLQVQWIVAMVDMIYSCDGLKAIYDAMRRRCEASFETLPLRAVGEGLWFEGVGGQDTEAYESP